MSTSALLKTALYGEDAKQDPHPPFGTHFSDAVERSWGRVLAAIGSIQNLLCESDISLELSLWGLLKSAT